MAEVFQYKAFLSYSHRDKKWGAWLHEQLEKYRPPKRLAAKVDGLDGNRTIGRIFRDRDELPAAEDLNEAVRKALETSEYLIVLCSPNAAASRWVNKEVMEFKRLRSDKYVLPIIFDGEPFASDNGAPELECFPPAVRFKIAKSGGLSTLPAEPAAADARKDADGKERAVLKLLAGILDVGLDQLVEREMRRRQKRVTAITAGAVAAMLVMATLTYQAVEARKAEARNRAEAEDLVEFMLTDLREKLEPVGRLDVLDAVGEKVLSYHDNQLSYEDASNDDIGRRARAYHLLAEMEYRRGNMDEAQTMFEQANEATGELLKRDPNNTQRIFEHAQSVFWVGNQAFERGQFQETEMAFRTYKEMADQLVALEPDNIDWLIEQAYGNHNMGDVYLRGLNKPREAIPFLEAAVTLFQNAYAARPDSLFLKRYVAAQYLALSDAHRQFGHLDQVIEFRQKQKETLEELLETSPQDQSVKEHLWLWYRAEGWLQAILLNSHSAIVQYEKATILLEELIMHEPSNIQLKEEAAILAYYKASLFHEIGNFDRAKNALSKAKQLSKSVLGMDYLGNRHQVALKYIEAYTLFDLANSTQQQKELSLKSFQALVVDLVPLSNALRERWLLVALFQQRIKKLAQLGDISSAKALHSNLLGYLNSNIDSQIPSILVLLFDVATMVQNADQAQMIKQTLIDRGYGHVVETARP